MSQFYLLSMVFLSGMLAALIVVGSVPGAYGMTCVVVVLVLLALVMMLGREYYLMRAVPQRRRLPKKKATGARKSIK
jgi:hypothetical protein